MPFKNCAQQRAMFAKNPKLAREWVKKYGDKCKGVSMTETRSKARAKSKN